MVKIIRMIVVPSSAATSMTAMRKGDETDDLLIE